MVDRDQHGSSGHAVVHDGGQDWPGPLWATRQSVAARASRCGRGRRVPSPLGHPTTRVRFPCSPSAAGTTTGTSVGDWLPSDRFVALPRVYQRPGTLAAGFAPILFVPRAGRPEEPALSSGIL